MKNQNIIKKKSGFVNNWVIVAALIIIAVIGGIIYYNYYFKNIAPGFSNKNQTSVNSPIIQEEETVKPESELVIISLSADKKEYNFDELVNVGVLLKLADKKTPGVDVLLKYDPKSLELQKIAGGKLQTSGIVSDSKQILKTDSSSFETFPYLKADILSGSIFFSALAQPMKDVIGEANIASIVFKAVRKGNTKISLVFDKSLNQDTGVFYMGEDILDKAIDFEIIIK
ncbi:MAG: hypothetical protein AAB405_02765 [Patescibacteria group bacterium]